MSFGVARPKPVVPVYPFVQRENVQVVVVKGDADITIGREGKHVNIRVREDRYGNLLFQVEGDFEIYRTNAALNGIAGGKNFSFAANILPLK